MMTQQLRFSVLSAPLAAIDRRALSQAWYSALFRAHDGAPADAGVTRREIGTGCEADAPSRAAGGRPISQRGEAIARRPRPTARTQPAPFGPHLDRRVPRSPLARRIERVFLHPSKPCERASFTLDGSAARVHVTLRRIGGTLRLVAICPPAARARVARALEEARFSLAARGIVCALDVKEA